MIKEINKLKTLAMHVSCKCKCKFDVRKCYLNQKWNNDKRRCECKRHYIREKDYIWDHATCSCKNCKYLASNTDDSVVTCDEIIEVTKTVSAKSTSNKTVPTNFNEKMITCKTKKLYVLLAFLLITIALLIAVSIYCYFIKY